MTPTFEYLCKRAAAMEQQPQKFMGIQEGGWGDLGMSLIPGVGTAYMGGKAMRDFSQGNIWSGVGNTALAAASLIPFAGGVAKGVGMLGRPLSWLMRGGKGMQGARHAVRRGAVNLARATTGGRTLLGVSNGAGKNMFNVTSRGLGYNVALPAAGVGALAMGAPGQPQPQAPGPQYDPGGYQTPFHQPWSYPQYGQQNNPLMMGSQWAQQSLPTMGG